MTYLRIRNWERFQHYKKRRPPWVKFYVELLDDPVVTRFPIATQLLLDRLLLVASLCDNHFVNDADWLSRKTHIPRKCVVSGVQELLACGFLEGSVASKALAERLQDARAETEVETETPKPPSPNEDNIQRVGEVVAYLFPGAEESA